MFKRGRTFALSTTEYFNYYELIFDISYLIFFLTSADRLIMALVMTPV